MCLLHNLTYIYISPYVYIYIYIIYHHIISIYLHSFFEALLLCMFMHCFQGDNMLNRDKHASEHLIVLLRAMAYCSLQMHTKLQLLSLKRRAVGLSISILACSSDPSWASPTPKAANSGDWSLQAHRARPSWLVQKRVSWVPHESDAATFGHLDKETMENTPQFRYVIILYNYL